MEEKELILPAELEEVIQAQCKKIVAENPKIKRVIPIVVEGNESLGEKPYYVAYMRTPDMKAFSKFMMTNSANSIVAQQNLAKDCFIDGDKELLSDDELFLMGLMPQLSVLIESRSAKIVNFSKA
jgi:hypothetical protein